MGRVQAGQLRERVTLLMPGTPVPDGSGGNRPGPVTELAVWARVVPVSSREQVALGQTLNSLTNRVTLRRREGITDKCRVRWQGKEYNILSLLADEDREYLTLLIYRSGQ